MQEGVRTGSAFARTVPSSAVRAHALPPRRRRSWHTLPQYSTEPRTLCRSTEASPVVMAGRKFAACNAARYSEA